MCVTALHFAIVFYVSRFSFQNIDWGPLDIIRLNVLPQSMRNKCNNEIQYIVLDSAIITRREYGQILLDERGGMTNSTNR